METSTPTQQPAAPCGLRHQMKRHPLFFFFLIAYLSSWILSVPFILSEWGVIHGDLRPIFAIKSFGPFLAAFVMARVLGGKPGLAQLRRQIRQWRASGWMYLFVLLGIPALLMLAILIQPGTAEGFKGLSPAVPVTYLVSYVLVWFGGGPLGEEPGWRGFALPRLQKRFGPLRGTLLLSVAWTGWHLPDFLTSAQGGGPGTGLQAFLTNLPIFFLLVTAIAFILTWVYNRTGGSVFMALLAHASVNTPQVALVPLFPAVDTTILNLGALIGLGIPAIVLILATRGRLGYQPDQARS